MEFKAALETTIPNNADPSLAIDKILAHFGRMEEGKASVPSYIQAMILLAKIPPAMESLAQLFCQSEEDVSKIDTPKIRRAILLAWEQKGYRKNYGGGQAQRITAVKRGPQEPEFTQQYKSGGFRGGRGRGGRGRPRGQRGQGGQKNPQNNVIQQDTQPTAGPSNHQQQCPLSAPPSEFDFGLFASPAVLPPPSSVYPTFNKALTLARRLEVRPTIETLKRLETPFLENPRPQKRRNVSDEEVSLGWTDNEVDAFMGGATTASGSKTPGNAFDINSFGAEERYATNLTLQTKANPSTVLSNRRVNTPVTFFNNVINKFVCLTLQDSDKNETEAKWMLDSGASRHFTFDINDYVDYETTAEVLVRTANSFTKIIGKGTVIITVDGKTVRINPVYHIPDLSC